MKSKIIKNMENKMNNYEDTMKIAFSAYTDHYTGNIRTGHIIKCHMVLLNDGNYYNASTGIFTPPEASSVYLFTFSIAAWHKDS